MKTRFLTFLLFSLALAVVFIDLLGKYGQTLNASSELALAFFGGLLTMNMIYLLYTYLFKTNV